MSAPVTRIAHVLGALDRGGVETWLMHVLRRLDRSRFQLDFFVHAARPGVFDEEARALGSKVVVTGEPSRPIAYARALGRALAAHGPYDAVHAHVHHFSGLVLKLAERAGVPVRIAHSHNDTAGCDASARPLRRAYLRLMARWIDRHATLGLACSRPAASALFGPRWRGDERLRVLPYGIELAPFAAPVSRRAVRRELGLPEDAFVIGHVGRFEPQKNHAGLVAIARAVVAREPRARFLLVGKGPLEEETRRRVAAAGLGERVTFAGLRGDVPRLMRGAMDAFALPSLYEGLGLVVVEAQAAGLPCVVSTGVPTEAQVVPGLVRTVPLEDTEGWVEALLRARMVSIDPAVALAHVARSELDARRSVARLEAVYEAARAA